jgi:hypothetical protein
LKRFDNGSIDLGNQRFRRFGWRHHAEPCDRQETGQTRFGDGRNIRKSRRAVSIGHGQYFEFSGPVLRKRGGKIVKHDVDVTTKEIINRRRAALVWDMHELDASHGLEQTGGQVRRRSGTLGSIGDFTRVRLCQRDQVLHGPGRDLGTDNQYVGARREHRNGRERRWIVRQPLIEIMIDGERARWAGQQGVSIRFRPCDTFGTNIASRPADIFDDDRLIPAAAHNVCNDPRQKVRRSSRRKRNDDRDGGRRKRFGTIGCDSVGAKDADRHHSGQGC